MDEVVHLQTLDGVWEVGGADRRRGIWPEDVNCNWDDWGPKTASFTLKRDPGAVTPDISGLTPIVIEKASGAWEGFVDATPPADWHALQLEAAGWQDYGSDDLEQKTYVHQQLSEWVDIRGLLDVNLSNWSQGLQAQGQDVGGIVLGAPVGATWKTATAVGVILDLGPGNACKRVVLDVERGPGAPAAVQLYCRTADAPGTLFAGGVDTTESSFSTTALPTIAQSSTLFSSSFATARRYVSIFLYNNGATYTPTNDDTLRIRNAIMFAETAYESGNASVLKASDVLKDALPRLCSLWSPDVTGVDATLLSLPHVAPTANRSFRDIVDALNSLHGYVAKLERNRRFRFKPQPSVPVVAVGSWPGADFKDTSKNATRDIYNKAIGSGQDGAGRPIKVERYTAQLAGIPGEYVATPAFPNPSFAVDVSGWTAVAPIGGSMTFTRDTTIFDTSPASMNVQDMFTTLANYMYTDASSGTFKKGIAYRITLRFRSFSSTHYVVLRLGSGSDAATAIFPAVPNSFTSLPVVWVPKADYAASAVRLEVHTMLATFGQNYNIDTITVEVVRPTLLDKRGRIRAQQVSIPSQAVDETVIQAFCDIWLQTHMRTRARGDLTVMGNAARQFTTHAPFHPFELGDLTRELVCLLDEQDPDTGAIGRNVPIAQVAYEGNTETAKISLDDNREDFEKVVARYELLSGS